MSSIADIVILAAGMGERLKSVRGDLSVDAKPQRGTIIHARVPLELKIKIVDFNMKNVSDVG